MKNRLGIVLLSLVVTLLCGYYLSLSLITRRVDAQADQVAVDSLGQFSLNARQAYLDSVWNEPVFDVLGYAPTYKELKETELSLGLDLQGGMHIVLEVSPSALLSAMARDPDLPIFKESLALAETRTRTGGDFLSAFHQAFQQEVAPGRPLTEIFAHVNTRDRIASDATDEDVLAVLQEEIDQAITRSFYILRARIDKFGTLQPNIQRLEGSSRIQIELPGIDNPARVRKLLQGIAELSFWEVGTPEKLGSTLSLLNETYVAAYGSTTGAKDLTDLSLEDADSAANKVEESLDETLSLTSDTDDFDNLSNDQEDGTGSLLDTADGLGDTSLAQDDTASLEDEDPLGNLSPLFALIQSRDRLLYLVKDTSKISQMLKDPLIAPLIPNSARFLWGAQPIQATDGEELMELYVLTTKGKKGAVLQGDVITDARQDFDNYGRPAVSMRMNTNGSKRWRKVTRENLNKQIAIVLDDRVYSAPVVETEIADGSSQISGNFSIEEAKDLANILKSGSLPAPTRIIEDVVIGPTLGRQAQRQGIISIICALVLVIIFMAIYYGRGGLIADLALAFNVFFILGILTQLNAALTLPGIAGIVLTMGMSIDANVLIFERIREELRRGSPLTQAISSGYARAYSSIVDANVTTFLTAAILYLLGQGAIKGFAVTLMVGIICSFFTAVFLTRLVIVYLVRVRKKNDLRFQTSLSSELFKNIRLSIISNRRIAYIISLAVVLLGLGAFFVKGGLNLGVDFLGGRAYIVSFSRTPQTPSALKVGLTPYMDNKGVEVKSYGNDKVFKITTNYLIGDESTEADSLVQAQVIDGLTAITGMNPVSFTQGSLRAGDELEANTFFISGSTKVGANIASDIKSASAKAIVLALVVIFFYIFIRFRRWQFGLAALVALFHDVLIVLAVFSIAHLLGVSFEVDQIFVAAMLTLIGYSINDTVVVFDRVRENVRLHPKSDSKETFNLALNETLSRTVITSATTLFVVVVLLLFGGAVLRGFSFTLLVGVITGTYSSLFIASPLVIDLGKRKKASLAPTA